jgi:hypothetical protein
MLFISCSRSWALIRLTVAGLFLVGSANAKANFWNLRDTNLQLEPPPWSDWGDLTQANFGFSPPLPPGNEGSWDKLKLINENVTLTVSSDATLDLRGLVLNDATLTLEATAGTAITINVTNRFSLLNTSNIVLSGGLRATDVVFNVIGPGGAARIQGNSSLTGTINALDRTVRISAQSVVTGTVNAENVILASDGTIVPPPIVSQ